MRIELRPLTAADAQAHLAGEDDETVRWLTGGHGTVEGAVRYFDELAANAAAGRGKRGFGVWLDDRLAGYVDCDPDDGAREPDAGSAAGLSRPGDVSLAYAVHPWARRRRVASEAVRLVCERIREERLGRRAVIHVEPANTASVGVARRSGFTLVGEGLRDGVPMSVYVLDL